MSQKLLKKLIISKIKHTSLRKWNFVALSFLRIQVTSSSSGYCEKPVCSKISKGNTQARFVNFNSVFNVSQLKYSYFLKMFYMCASNVTIYKLYFKCYIHVHLIATGNLFSNLKETLWRLRCVFFKFKILSLTVYY